MDADLQSLPVIDAAQKLALCLFHQEHNMQQPQVNVLNRQQAAKHLGLSLSSFHRAIREGRIPKGFTPTRNGHMRWHVDVLDRLLKQPA